MIWEYRKFRNIHHESTLADLFADKDLNDDDSNASDNDWGLNKNPKVDLKKIRFDHHVDGTEVQDLNIVNSIFTMVQTSVATLEFNTIKKISEYIPLQQEHHRESVNIYKACRRLLHHL